MDIQPYYKPLAAVFNDFLLEAPRYQRGYTWNDERVEDFLDNFDRCCRRRRLGKPRKHFLGGVVGIREAVPGSGRLRCQLIDGQQRVTTFVLAVRAFEIALRAAVAAGNFGQSGRRRSDAVELAGDLRQNHLTERLQVGSRRETVDRLTPTEPDREFFGSLLADGDELTHGPATRDSHKLLAQAIRLCHQRFTDHLAEHSTPAARMKAASDLSATLVADLTVILLIPSDPDDAYRLFQVLNDRGTKLGDGDLLRARTMELVGDDAHKSARRRVATAWDDILAGPPAETDQFLRRYYASAQGHSAKQSALFDGFCTAFLPNSGEGGADARSAKRLVSFVENLRTEHQTHRRLTAGSWPYESGEASPAERERLVLLATVLGYDLCLPLLMAAACLAEDDFVQVVSLTERVAFRYKIICNAHTTPLSNCYLAAAKRLRDNPTGFRVGSLADSYRELLARKTTVEEFEQGLRSVLVYQRAGGNAALKYFLLTADRYLGWFEQGGLGRPIPGAPDRQTDPRLTTIEHIHPQNPSEHGSGLAGRADELGNLTLIDSSAGIRAGNRPFSGKREVYQGSGFELTRRLAALDGWSVDTLADRQKRLHAFATTFFAMPPAPAPRRPPAG